MKNLIIGLMAIGLTNLCFSQNKSNGIAEVQLEGVVISAPNYNYLMSVLEESTSSSVKDLELEAARYNIKDSKVYDPNVESFQVVFKQSNGKIIAIYDNDGQIVKSYERFKNVILPREVLTNIFMDHQGWEINKDTYQVTYNRGKEAKKVYKVQLRKGELKKNLKLDSEGRHLKLVSVD